MVTVLSLRLFLLCAAFPRLCEASDFGRQDVAAAVASGASAMSDLPHASDRDGDSTPSGAPKSEPAPASPPGPLSPARSILPSSTLPTAEPATIDWTGLARASGRFLGIEHGFRLLTEPGTREGLKGSFIHNYTRAVGGLHGWADGDEFYVNFVGHPMQGSVAGFLWVGNDRRYRREEFGRSPAYWKGRLRAVGFVWLYSTQFEIGTISEASIGSIQATPPQQGFVDHVITPAVGMGWIIAEDALDKYVVKRVEAATPNRWLRLLARTGMNPSRTFSNVLRGTAPWHRETREGITAYRPGAEAIGTVSPAPAPAETPDTGPAPFELNMALHTERIGSGAKSLSCVGGGATAALRVASAWQMVVDVGGCNLFGLDRNLSGDSLAYMAGPRWVRSGSSAWSAYLQFLVGGNKLTEERMYPERKKLLEQLAVRNGAPPPMHEQYTQQMETNGFALATGGGVDYKLTRALAIRVAELSYRHSWVGPLGGRNYSESLKLVTGLVLRMGTW
jgi:hypothetical protein